MTPEEFATAERAAAEVVNGFKTPKERNARDVLRLVSLVRVRERQIESLRAELEAARGADPFRNLGL